MAFEIKDRWNGSVIYRSETATTIKAAVLECVEKARGSGARANLADANLADANLAGANLADANLAGADLAGAYLARANLADADLADADLAGAYLARAYLARANLADADLAGARNVPTVTDAPARSEAPREPYRRLTNPNEIAERYRGRHPEVPVIERLDAKILERIEQGGALDMGHWHSCETTHCRAGWAIHLAGEAGAELERKHGPFHAGAMIYRASLGRAPHFFATNERAMEDIRRCAAEQNAEGA
jgi:hypothetical protein